MDFANAVQLRPELMYSYKSMKFADSEGLHCTEVAYSLLPQQPRVWFLALPKAYFDVAEIYRRCWLEESQLDLVPASYYKKHYAVSSSA